MQNTGGEFTVQMRGEPEARLQVREQLRTGRTAEHSAREILPEVRLQLLKDRVESSGIVHPKTRDIDNTNRKDHEKKMRNGMNSEHTP